MPPKISGLDHLLELCDSLGLKMNSLSDELTTVSTLAELHQKASSCTRCGLRAGCKGVVFGVGNHQADIMFVGEAPGYMEDVTGVPFSGPAGDMLTEIISAMGFTREQVYIANMVKCRPPGNRDPEPHELDTCSPWLRRQIELISPRIIYGVGRFASQFLTARDESISRLRGRSYPLWGKVDAIPVVPMYHTAFALRRPEAKQLIWDDIKLGLSLLNLTPARGS